MVAVSPVWGVGFHVSELGFFLVVWMGWFTGSGDQDAVLEALLQVLEAFVELQEELGLGCLAG